MALLIAPADNMGAMGLAAGGLKQSHLKKAGDISVWRL